LKRGALYRRRGQKFEYRVKRHLEKEGYTVFRVSKGPIDLIALKKGEVLLVECKVSNIYVTSELKRRLFEISEKLGVGVAVAYRIGRKLILEKLPVR